MLVKLWKETREGIRFRSISGFPLNFVKQAKIKKYFIWLLIFLQGSMAQYLARWAVNRKACVMFTKWIAILDSTATCDDDIKIEFNVSLFLGIANLMSMVNNIIVTVLWSKNICNSNCNSIDSSITIASVCNRSSAW